MRFSLYCIAVLIGFSALQWRGVNLLPAPGAGQGSAGAHQSRVGYRSYHPYHGFHGGK
ncbi:MAG TPA: hypothetical protein VJV78_34875 [Polyangiales bacterium]|nr:hypothetical protein [Polyangiales bacterium]